MLSKAKLAEIRALHQKKHREESGLFIAEGLKTVLEILSERQEILFELFALPEFIHQHGKLISATKVPVYEIKESELQRVSLQDKPNQVMAICRKMSEADLKYDFEQGFTFYFDDLRDPGNFGTLLRIAAWYGINKVFCTSESCELYNPKVIQSSMGAFMRVNVVYCQLEELLQENSIQSVYGAVLNGKNIYKETLGNGLIVIGNEANGISAEYLKKINRPITIPKAGSNKTESLNAAVASGIICSEFFRQLKME